MSKDKAPEGTAVAEERRRRSTDPRIHARRVEVARQHGRRRRWRILAAMTVVGLLAGGFEMLHSSVLGARHVRVFGASNIPRAAVIGIAGLTNAPPLVDLDTGSIATRVEKLPWVLEAVVSVAWPSTVDIKVTERTPVAVLPDPGTGGSWAVTDQYGRVLEVVPSRPASLPVVAPLASSTVAGKSYSPGAYLPATLAQLAQVAAALPESMVAETSEITSSSDGIVVEMPGHPLAIVGNPSSLQQKFVSLATVLARTDLNGVSAIDLRVPAAPVLLDKQSSPIVAGHVGG